MIYILNVASLDDAGVVHVSRLHPFGLTRPPARGDRSARGYIWKFLDPGYHSWGGRKAVMDLLRRRDAKPVDTHRLARPTLAQLC
jgi:hypothetical protein